MNEEAFIARYQAAPLDTPVDALDGDSPLHFAAYHGFTRYLQKTDQETFARLKDSQNQHSLTPLHLAAAAGNKETVAWLLDKGCSTKVQSKDGRTALYSSCFLPLMHDPEMVKAKEEIALGLLQKMSPESIKAIDSEGGALLHQVVLHPFYELRDTLLKNYPLLLDVQNNRGHYPIHVALLNPNEKNIASLLAIDGVAAQTDFKGQAAIHYAAFYGSKETLAMCVNAAKDRINAVDSKGQSALHLAVKAQSRDNLNYLLLQGGINTELRDEQGKSPLDYAIALGWSEGEALLSPAIAQAENGKS